MKVKINFQEIITRIKTDKKLIVIIVIGLVGMLLLLFSEIFDSSDDIDDSAKSTESSNTQYTYEQNYKKQVQQDLQKLISSIDGAGNTKVMVTIESGTKSVYAVDENIKDTSNTSDDNNKYSRSSEYSRDTEHIIVNSSSKDEDGLIVEIIQPQIRGVAVVCQGADSAVVRQNITNTVTAVLNISSTRVCITKMTKD